MRSLSLRVQSAGSLAGLSISFYHVVKCCLYRYDAGADGIIFATCRTSSPDGKRILATLPHVRLDLVISVLSLSIGRLSY